MIYVHQKLLNSPFYLFSLWTVSEAVSELSPPVTSEQGMTAQTQ